jgi:hypothetical protein
LVHFLDHSQNVGLVHGAGNLVEHPLVPVQGALEVHHGLAFGSGLVVKVEEADNLVE